jgi:hypothetical protein
MIINMCFIFILWVGFAALIGFLPMFANLNSNKAYCYPDCKGSFEVNTSNNYTLECFSSQFGTSCDWEGKKRQEGYYGTE